MSSRTLRAHIRFQLLGVSILSIFSWFLFFIFSDLPIRAFMWSCEIPQKTWARSAQTIWRLSVTNKQTDKQSKLLVNLKSSEFNNNSF